MCSINQLVKILQTCYFAAFGSSACWGSFFWHVQLECFRNKFKVKLLQIQSNNICFLQTSDSWAILSSYQNLFLHNLHYKRLIHTNTTFKVPVNISLNCKYHSNMGILKIMPVNLVNVIRLQCQWKIAHNKLVEIPPEKCLLKLS